MKLQIVIKACLLLFTESKPSKLLDLILLSNFLGSDHMPARGFFAWRAAAFAG